MSYRPLTDVMILARSKTAYYGAFPAGFLHRGRALLGVKPDDAVLHVCGGKVRDYPFKGLGPNDRTADIDASLNPDFVMDVRTELPHRSGEDADDLWDGIMIDRPYTEEDAAHYAISALPNINDLLQRCLQLVPIGCRVGVLDYLWPHPGKFGTEVAVFAVGTGRNSRARWFCVFERVL